MLTEKPKKLAKLAIPLVLSVCILTLGSEVRATQGKSPKPASSQARLLWDEWYTVTVGSKTHYGYYNEKVELRNNQIFMKNEFWKQEEDYINREDLGAVAENDDELTPIFFNFRSVYRTTETVIDGTVKNRKFLSVRARKSGQELPIVQRTLPAKVFLSSQFSVWLGKHLSRLEEGKTTRFATVMEDNLEQQFQIMNGSVKLEKADDFAKATHTKMLRVESRGIRSTWWVNDRGIAERIDMPEQKIRVDRVSRDRAKKFLGDT